MTAFLPVNTLVLERKVCLLTLIWPSVSAVILSYLPVTSGQGESAGTTAHEGGS